MDYIVIAAISLGLVFAGCMLMLVVAIGVVLHSRKRVGSATVQAQQPTVSPEVVEIAPEAFEAPDVRDTKPQPRLVPEMSDVVSEILDEEHRYAMLLEDDVATSVRREVRLPQPVQTPAYNLPFNLAAADYEKSGPLPMPVAPLDLEPIPELEPTQLMAHQPQF